MNDWNDALKNYGPITQTKCGENRYIGVQNILEFYITGQCQLFVVPRNAIQTKVRMEWSLDSFYNNGGTTLLIDRIAASLGIHASTIKIVSVYEGSLVVNYNIYTPTDDTFQLEQIEVKQTQQIAKNEINFGAPVLDTTINTKGIVSDGVLVAQGYEPVIITPTPTNQKLNLS